MMRHQVVPFPLVPKVHENTQINRKQELSDLPKYRITYSHRIPSNMHEVSMGYPYGLYLECHGLPLWCDIQVPFATPWSLPGMSWATPWV